MTNKQALQASGTVILPQSDLVELQRLLDIKHTLFLDGRKFVVEATAKDNVVSVKVLLSNADKSFYYPVEGRMDFLNEEMSKKEAALFLIDYIDLYFEDYFSDENTFIPIDWASYSYEGTDFQLKGQILNLKIEEMADQFLAAHELAANSPTPLN